MCQMAAYGPRHYGNTGMELNCPTHLKSCFKFKKQLIKIVIIQQPLIVLYNSIICVTLPLHCMKGFGKLYYWVKIVHIYIRKDSYFFSFHPYNHPVVNGLI